METYSISPLIEKVIATKHDETGEIPTHKWIVRFLEKHHPDAVDEYLTTHRSSLLSGAITRTLADQRNQLRSSQLAVRLMDGTVDSVFDLDKFWSTAVFVQGEGWKPLESLTGSDHTRIADKYGMGAIALLSRENLHRDLAKKVGKKKTTREVFEAGPLLQMITRAYDTPALMGGAR
jgi:hypothetical protein